MARATTNKGQGKRTKRAFPIGGLNSGGIRIGRIGAWFLVAVSCLAFAQEERKFSFEIPQQSVHQALLELAQQAQLPILLPVNAFIDLKANELNGEYSVPEALDRLLEGTSVRARLDQSGQLIVERTVDKSNNNNLPGEERMYKNRNRKNLLAAAIAVLSGSAATVAHAQQDIPDRNVEEISVTGSRIRTTSTFTTPVPVTSVTLDELADFEPGNSMAEQLDALPQFFGNQSSQRGALALHSTAGASGLNIRRLGTNRTLVLLDGHRVVPTDKRGTVNVDIFPTALLRSVDVVTGGASAAYGADAVGGTVNFVLDRRFEGLNVSAGTGVHETGEGVQWNLEMAGGTRIGDRLHLIAGLSAMHIDEVRPNWRELDSFKFIGHITNPAWQPGAPAGVPQRLTRPWVSSATSSPTGLIRNTRTILDNYKFSDDGKELVLFDHGEGFCQSGNGCLGSQAGGREGEVRSRAYDFFAGAKGAEVVNRSMLTSLEFEATDRLSAYTQIMVGRTESNGTLDESYEAEDNWGATVFIDNAYLPEQVRQIMLDNNLTQFSLSKMGSFDQDNDIGGYARNVNVFTQWQYSFGFDYRIPGLEWDLSGSWQQGESKRNSQAIERVRNDRMFLAMDAVRDGNGNIVCRVQLFNPTREQLAASVAGRISPVPVSPYLPLTEPGNSQPLKSPIGLDNTIEDCVPFNIMGSGNISPEAIDYIGTPKIQHAYVDQDFAEVLLTGDLYEGWGYGAVSLAAGLTWRDQQFIDTAGPISVVELGPPVNVPSLGIQGFPPGITGGSANLHAFSTVPFLGGQADVWEWFSEINVPIWEGSIIGGQEQQLGTNFAFRRSNYDRSGAVDSWKVGVNFQVLNDLRLRLTRSQDVREPNFSELFDVQGGGGNVLDPRYNNASFPITRTAGGNPDLAPEEAQTIVAGFVYEPSFAAWVEGVQMSVDWYKVEVEGAVSTLGVQRIVDECEINGMQSLCQQIIRDPSTGFITRVLDTFLNVAQEKVEGLDVELSYRAEPDLFGSELESFSIRALGGYIMERSDTPLGGVPFDQAGARGTPEITTTITGTYAVGPWSAQLAARYYDSVLFNARWVEGVDVDDNTIPSMTWFNARLGYEQELSSGASWNVNFNIQNLFDREPPVVPGFNSRGGTQVVDNNYDVFGRRYNLSFNYKF